MGRIYDSTTIPKLYGATTRPATTGWFLPGKLEWDIVHANYAIVNNALSQTNAGKELGNTAYWSTEETGKDYVCIYRPGASSNYRSEVKKTSTAAVRGVFWL